MRRRDVITFLSGTVFCLHRAEAQEKIRRIGLLMPYAEDDPSASVRITALKAGLRELGWTEGANVRVDIRYAPKLDLLKTSAAELVRQSPELLITSTNLATITLHRETATIPIVFIGGGDMIKEGLVESLARPGGNVTGFTNFEPAMGSKWLELLTEMSPTLGHVGFLYNPETLANLNDMLSAQSSAPSFHLQIVPLSVHNGNEVDRAIRNFAAGSNAGMIVAPNPVTISNHDLIVELAAYSHLPTIYPFDFYARAGGLMSYGPDQVDMFKRASSYIDQILKGASPGALPVQMPTKFELIVNQTTAKALGLLVPVSILARADQVIG
jgi:putative ABC transport system substrate-binding protein